MKSVDALGTVLDCHSGRLQHQSSSGTRLSCFPISIRRTHTSAWLTIGHGSMISLRIKHWQSLWDHEEKIINLKIYLYIWSTWESFLFTRPKPTGDTKFAEHKLSREIHGIYQWELILRSGEAPADILENGTTSLSGTLSIYFILQRTISLIILASTVKLWSIVLTFMDLLFSLFILWRPRFHI